jgi:hypothetical protein
VAGIDSANEIDVIFCVEVIGGTHYTISEIIKLILSITLITYRKKLAVIQKSLTVLLPLVKNKVKLVITPATEYTNPVMPDVIRQFWISSDDKNIKSVFPSNP